MKELFYEIVAILKNKYKGEHTYNADVKVNADGTKFLLFGKQILVDNFEIINVSYDVTSNVLSFEIWHNDDIEVELPYLDVFLDEECSVCYSNQDINSYLDDRYYFDKKALQEIIAQIK